MRRILEMISAAVMAGGLAASAQGQIVTPEIRSQIGDNRYFEDAVMVAERGLRSVGAARSGWRTFSAAPSGGTTTYRVPASGPGYIVAAGDQDTGEICLYPFEGQFVNAVGASCGQRRAIVSIPEGEFQIRVEIPDCRAVFCYFVVMTGY